MMCQFGCMFQLTCDNGSEFRGAVQELMQKYNVPVVHISPYNSQANGKIKWTQHSYLEAIWKVLDGEDKSPDYIIWTEVDLPEVLSGLFFAGAMSHIPPFHPD